jgi:uncharacterized protein HemY
MIKWEQMLSKKNGKDSIIYKSRKVKNRIALFFIILSAIIFLLKFLIQEDS